METWDWTEWLRIGLIVLIIFAAVGGIVSQTTAGVSGRGFMEGMWKGVEWFLIVVLVFGALLFVAWVMGLTSIALNT